MYTKLGCGYCAAARKLLTAKGVEFEDIDVTMDSALRQKMVELSNGTTVPQIFIDATPIGGYDDLAALDASGELDRMLDPAAGNDADTV